ncbi:MAG: DUF4065 domain-containing protein [Victivallaceae bacterium]|nr:DUF4065 domain-containing protein [Victivallaceae bacterium]
MSTCIDVANYFLRCPEYSDPSDAISNMKLQKLLYFAQGHALAILGHPLFDEDFEAWPHGPVIPSIYQRYKQYKGDAIVPPQSVDLKSFKPDEKALLEQVWLTYGGYSAWGLSNLSHVSMPWKTHKESGGTIAKDEMCAYFATLNETA